MKNMTQTPIPTADEVVSTEVKVAQKREHRLTPAAEKLANHAEGKDDCEELVEYCRDWAKFEQNHIDALKMYL